MGWSLAAHPSGIQQTKSKRYDSSGRGNLSCATLGSAGWRKWPSNFIKPGPTISRAGGSDTITQRRRFLQQWVNALARETLGQFYGGLHREHRCWHVMKDIAQPIITCLGRAHLRALHEYNPPRRMHGRKRIHHITQLGRAACAPGAGFG